MLTVIGIVLVSGACIGFVMQQIGKQKRRLRAMGDFSRLLSELAKSMDFTGETLPNILKELASEEGEAADFAELLVSELSKEEPKPFFELWKQSLEKVNERLSLGAEALSILHHAGKRLGTQAKDEEISGLNKAALALKEQMEKEEESFLKNEKLLKSSGVLIGLFIIILFI
ncbi:MAG: stage III sporulation protein AB [Clostridia bacterium]|nr:stage III sporulation protein AB [Clostridia bacterium]